MDNRAYASVLCLVVLALVTPATAQESDDEPIQEVIVTGSFIKRSNYDSPSPVTSIGHTLQPNQ
jgi:outer membrane receptor for ferrienterochelin and colicin